MRTASENPCRAPRNLRAPLTVSKRPAPSRIRLRDGAILKFPAVMGVLNVTPDSFSDGGLFLDPDRAAEHALAMAAGGADIVDIGGESTRPAGAREVAAEEELRRVIPVLERLRGKIEVPISIDTRKAIVARAAIELGAAIINDVSAMEADPEMAPLAARTGAAVVLMHMRGGPEDHIKFARYHDVVGEVRDYLAGRARFARRAGIARGLIILDPGIGFSKLARHNLALLRGLPSICALGYPVLVGCSRKGFVSKIAGGSARDLEFGTAAADALAVAAGAAIVRVHDPAAARATVRMAAAVADGALK
jgi:dihydropteroate synthase